jgi:hypothetical protein
MSELRSLSVEEFYDSQWLDDEGRPLSEPEAFREPIADFRAKMVHCTFPGSRHGRLINSSGLAQLGRHWDEIMDSFALVGTEYRRRFPSVPEGIGMCFRIIMAVRLLPSYLFLRAEKPFASGKLPAVISGVYKASDGIVTTLKHMLIESFDRGAGARAYDPSEAHRVTEDFGLFLTGEQWACAGAPNMVDDALRGLQPDSAARADRAQVGAIIGDFDALFRYAHQHIAIHVLRPLIAAARLVAYRRAAAAVGAPGADSVDYWMPDDKPRDFGPENRVFRAMMPAFDDPARRSRIVSGLLGYVADCVGPSKALALTEALFAGSDAIQGQLAPTVEAVLDLSRDARDPSLDAATARTLVEELVRMARIERAIFAVVGDATTAANHALGRPELSDEVTVFYVWHVRRDREATLKRLGVSVTTGSRSTRFTAGSRTLEAWPAA